LLINQSLYQEIATFIRHLSVEEKFKLIPYLAASHTEDLIGYHLLLNFLNLQVCSGGHRFYNWLILGKLHPKTLESI
jgi:hypothetical protein